MALIVYRYAICHKPAVARARLTIEGYWAIYLKAGELRMPGLQIAMGISLLTTMRRADVVGLRFDTHVQGQLLRQIVGKSAAQRGDVHATRLEWDLAQHAALGTLIKRARKLRLEHYRCPIVISHKPESGQDLPYLQIDLQLPAEVLGGEF